MKMTGNLALEWRKFRSQYEIYETASDVDEKPTAKRAAILLNSIGPDAYEIFQTLDMAEADRKKIDKVLEALEKHFVGETNEIYERYTFNCREQEVSETFDNFLAELRRLVKSCNYEAQQDSILRDRIVIGIRDDAVRRKLLQTRKLTLKDAIDLCKANEAATIQLKAMTLKEDNVNALKKQKAEQRDSGKSTHEGRKSPNRSQKACGYCGSIHEKRKCPAFGKSCNKCKKMNHFATVCRSKSARQVNELYVDSDAYDEEQVLSLAETKPNRLYAHLTIAEQPVRFLLDGGSTVNLLPLSLVENRQLRVRSSDAKLKMFDNANLKTCGMTTATVTHPRTGQCEQIQFYVTELHKQPLLGLQAILLFELMTIREENICAVSDVSDDAILSEFADLFDGYGTLPGTVHLVCDETIQPVRVPLRKIPVPIKAKVEKQLRDMKKNDIITEVTGPTPWISALLVVNKPNGDVRICIDPKPLNKALQRDHYPMPTIDDVLPKLAKAKIFSTIDAKSGFWHCKLDEESSKLTTFETPYGKYRWLRMPFGISPAPEIFQRLMHEALEGLDGIACIADDILIYGSGDTVAEATRDHDRNLIALLRRCREKGIRLNKDKLKLHRPEVTYMGHQLTETGIRSDPRKVDALVKMPPPVDKQGVSRILGMATYLSRYISNFSEITSPLRELVKKDNEFVWDPTFHGKAFDELKRLLSIQAVLAYYDVGKAATIQCDSSKSGLGGALLQEGKIVECVSRALTQTEQQYAQIEKELLAIVYAMERLHTYVYGRHVTVETDHKPLISIIKKPLTAAPKRLQRMLLRLQRYDFELVFKPGTQVVVADTLSRAYLPAAGAGTKFTEELAALTDDEVNAELRMVASEQTIRTLKAAANDDEQYQLLKRQIKEGWPENARELSRDLKEYHTFLDELTTVDDLIYKGSQVVVPVPARPQMLERIHSSHIGINGCIRRAREVLFWPGMTTQIKTSVEKCSICQEHQRSQTKEPLCSHPATSRPWEKVGIDIFTFNNYNYLMTTDYFSNYFEVDRLPSKKVVDIVYVLKYQFARHGIPDIVFSDNSPFNSREFRAFASDYEFKHETSSPRYPQSNGKVENSIKTAKNLMQKAFQDKKDPFLALLDWRNTPSEQLKESPAQIMFGRRTRTKLPISEKLLQTSGAAVVKQHIAEAKKLQAYYYDRTARQRPSLEPGTTVRFKIDDNSEWQKGEVTKALPHRSYEIQTEDGSTRRRTSKHVRLTRERPIVLNNDPAAPSPSQAEGNDQVATRIIPSTVNKNTPIVTKSGRVVRKPARYRE